MSPDLIDSQARPSRYPHDSLAADSVVTSERTAVKGATRLWFAHVPAGLSLREMKVIAHEYDSVMTLLVLPRGQPWHERGRPARLPR